MATATCECCRTKQGTPVSCAPPPGRSRRVLANLCKACVDDGHSVGICIICAANGTPVPTWNCGRLSHVAECHPRTVEKLVNDPFKELAPKPSPFKLGTYYYDKRERS